MQRCKERLETSGLWDGWRTTAIQLLEDWQLDVGFNTYQSTVQASKDPLASSSCTTSADTTAVQVVVDPSPRIHLALPAA